MARQECIGFQTGAGRFEHGYNPRPSQRPRLTPPTPPHPDHQLPAPLRWMTRLFSSLWLVGVLTLACLAYVAAAYLPIGGSYLWQQRWIDLPQAAVLAWPLFHGVWLALACVIAWATARRLAWRWRNTGGFIAAFALAAGMVGQSAAWRYQTRGLLPVRVTDNEAAAVQTRYLEPAQRVLTVQMGISPPQQIPLAGLPWWHDAPGGTLSLPLHHLPGLRSQLDYRAQVHAMAYIADGRLTPHEDGKTLRPAVTEHAQRDNPSRNVPTRALLALRFTANSAQGPAEETTVWLPFDLAAGQRVMPPQAYEVAGLGQVHLAFTLASRDLGFGVAAEPAGPAPPGTPGQAKLRVIDTDPQTRQVIPAWSRTLSPGQPVTYRPTAPRPGLRQVDLIAGPQADGNAPRWVQVHANPGRRYTLACAITALGGVLLAVGTRLTPLRRTDDASH